MFIDSLPPGPRWKCTVMSVTGDKLDEKGTPVTEEHELWHRDPVECIEELLSNPSFNGHMDYAPVRHYRQPEKKNRAYSEMSTGEWWWQTQVRIPVSNST